MTNKNWFEIVLNRKERKHFDEHVSDFKIVIESTLIQACTHVCICVHMFIDLCVCGSFKLPRVVCRYLLLIYWYNLKYEFVMKHLKIPKSNSCITLWGNNRILGIVIIMTGPYNQKMHDHDFIIGNQDWLPKIHMIHECIELHIFHRNILMYLSNIKFR